MILKTPRIGGVFRMMVRHVAETTDEINSVEDGSQRTGMWQAMAPFRQLYVLQIIRYWAELLGELQNRSQRISHDIPFFSEVFARFYNNDEFLRTRKTWEKN